VIREEHDADWEPPAAEADIYAMRLDGPEFEQDRVAVYTLLYNCCNHERASGRLEALAWIEPSFDTHDGRAAFAAFRTHFEGEGAMNIRKNEAFAKIQTLHWKSEVSMTFAEFSSRLKTAYDTIAEEAPYSDVHKVNHLLDKMMPMTRVQAIEVVKGTILDNYQNDFNGAVTYAKGRITSIYKEEIARMNKFGSGKRARTVYETHTERGGRGRGRRDQRGGAGRSGGNRGGYRGGGGRWANNNGTMFSGIDVSDVTRDFTTAEWDQIGPAGRAYVNQERNKRNAQGRGRGGRGGGRGGYHAGGYGGGYARGGGGRGGTGGGRTINEISVPGGALDNESTVADSVTFASRGGLSGAGFGRGAHGGRSQGGRT
jgi:hypothetical protein